MDRATFRRVMGIISKEFPSVDWSREMDPFEVLVSVVISQNTTVANERRALERLRKAMEITPRALSEAPLEVLQEALRPAGLHRTKAPRLRQIASEIRDRHGGDLMELLRLPLKEARRALMKLPGVGPKTADVVLSMVAGLPTFPVDTHIWRIARRWEVASGKSYAEVNSSLEALVPAEERRAAHLSLIKFGREICLARQPLCASCPVQGYCPYFQKLRPHV